MTMMTSNSCSVSIGRRLRELRIAMGHSQESLAAAANVSPALVYKIEAGGTARLSSYLALAQALGVEAVWFVDPSTSSETTRTGDAETAPPLTPPGRTVEPSLIPHWSNMLRVLARTQNQVGGQLHQVVRGELSIIGSYREQAADLQADLLTVEAQWSEFASWTALNLGDRQESDYWLNRALSLAECAEHRPLIAYTRVS